VSRKFKKFLLDNCDGSSWDDADDLFMMPPPFWFRLPDSGFAKALGEIYNARSRATHLGHRFPSSASYIGGPRIDPGLLNALLVGGSIFPPVAWFERVVNTAIRTHWERCIQIDMESTSAAASTWHQVRNEYRRRWSAPRLTACVRAMIGERSVCGELAATRRFHCRLVCHFQ
jgi:hypothetical protein